MGETTDNRPNNQEGQSFTAREFELIQELVRSRMEKNEELQYESFEGYELPPRTQFSMLKKPAVSIKYGQLTFNMAAIRLFEGVKHVLTVVNTEKKRLAVVPCAEEESASVECTLGGKTVTIGGMCKGAGMIHPNMGTMLSFITSDAAIDQKLLQQFLSEIVEDTFNMISVDGDTSTNDTAILLANGLAGNQEITYASPEYETFKEALHYNLLLHHFQ